MLVNGSRCLRERLCQVRATWPGRSCLLSHLGAMWPGGPRATAASVQATPSICPRRCLHSLWPGITRRLLLQGAPPPGPGLSQRSLGHLWVAGPAPWGLGLSGGLLLRKVVQCWLAWLMKGVLSRCGGEEWGLHVLQEASSGLVEREALGGGLCLAGLLGDCAILRFWGHLLAP